MFVGDLTEEIQLTLDNMYVTLVSFCHFYVTVVHVPTAAGSGVLSLSQCVASRPEATEPAHQQGTTTYCS